nr:hypothetical protein [Chlamydiota bacterium]
SVDFDRPFYVQSRERLKSPSQQDEFKRSLNQLGAMWAEVIDDIYETRASGLEATSKILKTHVKERNRINQEFYKLIDEVHANTKKEDTFSFIYNLVEFFLISTGMIGGAGLVAFGLNSGSLPAAYYGLEMMAGSGLSMGSFALKQLGYDPKYVAALALGGALLTGFGLKQGFAVFAREGLAKTLSAISSGAFTINNAVSTHMDLGSQKTKSLLEGRSNELTIERVKTRDDLKKALGAFKMEGHSDLVRAASKQMETEEKVKSRILQNSKT